jgi:tetraacyldisaccharide 4'-kinase
MARFILKLGAALYWGVTRLRGSLYDLGIFRSYRSRIPVISIGNVTVGGNGKTPLALYLAAELAARGWRPVILSRGYGGRFKGPQRVSATNRVEDVGDEPLLMAQTGDSPVYIARSRAAGARLIESDASGDVILLDDGLQHRALARNLDIISIFAGNELAVTEFAKGELLPLGLFREVREVAMIVIAERRVVLDSKGLAPIDTRLMNTLPVAATVYRSFFEASEVQHLTSAQPLGACRVNAFAGIANPDTFFESLEQLGYTLLGKNSFADHHAFSEVDLQKILAQYPGIPLVCTAKDAVKLAGMSVELRSQCAVMRVKLKVIPSDAFIVQIERKIR